MIRHATRVAGESVFHRARVGAVIAKGKRILSTGHNYIGNCKYLPNRPYPESVHAEQAAISKLLKEKRLDDLAGATLYVSRILRNGHTANSRPCNHCRGLAMVVGIREIIYTLDGQGVGSYHL